MREYVKKTNAFDAGDASSNLGTLTHKKTSKKIKLISPVHTRMVNMDVKRNTLPKQLCDLTIVNKKSDLKRH